MRASQKLLRFAIPIVVLALSGYLLHRASEQISKHEIMSVIHHMPVRATLYAIGATICSFLLLSTAELLGFWSAGVKLDRRRIRKVSLISFGFSNMFSFVGLTGASLRFRFYLKDRMDKSDITKITAFSSYGIWLGVFAIIGISAFYQPIHLPKRSHIPDWEIRTLGILSFIGIMAYLIMAWFQKPKIRFRGVYYSLPTFGHALAQISVAAVYWTMSGSVLYALLPTIAGVGFYKFLCVYLIGQTVGTISTVPGGLGILETFTVYLLAPGSKLTAPIVGALVLFRVIYYLIPLVLATIFLAIEEFVHHKKSELALSEPVKVRQTGQ